MITHYTKGKHAILKKDLQNWGWEKTYCRHVPIYVGTPYWKYKLDRRSDLRALLKKIVKTNKKKKKKIHIIGPQQIILNWEREVCKCNVKPLWWLIFHSDTWKLLVGYVGSHWLIITKKSVSLANKLAHMGPTVIMSNSQILRLTYPHQILNPMVFQILSDIPPSGHENNFMAPTTELGIHAPPAVALCPPTQFEKHYLNLKITILNLIDCS